ncbi:MAG: TAXI family TRAP transporter solute-binding subunit [Burkholderiales bacterium]|nr:TAXI family TRAP transporter solute-binding subunit [Burkholderiales bacterium]
MKATLFVARLCCLLLMFASPLGFAQQKLNLSIGSGATGGVFYPLGGGIAQVLSRNVPGWQVTAEVTGGSVDNLKLVGSGRSDLGFTMADAAWDAYKGQEKFKSRKLPLRALLVLYQNKMHAVTVEATGLASIKDLAGKRVSVGAPGSATEIMAMRILEAYGLSDAIRRERLSVNESVNALKDRKIDAFFWAGGVPTAAVTDLAASPGAKIRLLDHADAVDAMNRKYGPLYSKGQIPQTAYSGMTRDVGDASVWNLLVVNESMPDDVAYAIVKTVFERKADLVAIHRDFGSLELSTQLDGGSPLPFHPGAAKYFAEKGVKPKR